MQKENEVTTIESMGTQEAAKLWGYQPATIQKWCREKKLANVRQDAKGCPWHIPRTDKPVFNIIKKETSK